jgi:hypothetical protein
MDFPAPHARRQAADPWSTAITWYPSLNVAKGQRLCENSAREFVWSRRARIFAIFVALRGDRPRNSDVALAISEFSHSLGGLRSFPSSSRKDSLASNCGSWLQVP